MLILDNRTTQGSLSIQGMRKLLSSLSAVLRKELNPLKFILITYRSFGSIFLPAFPCLILSFSLLSCHLLYFSFFLSFYFFSILLALYIYHSILLLL